MNRKPTRFFILAYNCEGIRGKMIWKWKGKKMFGIKKRDDRPSVDLFGDRFVIKHIRPWYVWERDAYTPKSGDIFLCEDDSAFCITEDLCRIESTLKKQSLGYFDLRKKWEDENKKIVAKLEATICDLENKNVVLRDSNAELMESWERYGFVYERQMSRENQKLIAENDGLLVENKRLRENRPTKTVGQVVAEAIALQYAKEIDRLKDFMKYGRTETSCTYQQDRIEELEKENAELKQRLNDIDEIGRDV